MALGTQVLSSVSVVNVGTVSRHRHDPGRRLALVGLGRRLADDPARLYWSGERDVVGKDSRTITIPVDYEMGDSGQAMLPPRLSRRRSSTARFSQTGRTARRCAVRVSHQEIHAPDANGFNTATWTLEQAGSPVVVGTGFGT
jgi:hypothetical protein